MVRSSWSVPPPLPSCTHAHAHAHAHCTLHMQSALHMYMHTALHIQMITLSEVVPAASLEAVTEGLTSVDGREAATESLGTAAG